MQVPTRRQISHTLLRNVLSTVKAQVSENCRGLVCLATDIWINLSGQPVVNYVATTREGTFFVDGVAPGEATHTAEWIAADLKRIIEQVGPTKVIGVVTDNSEVNIAARSIVQAEYPAMFFTGCSCFVLNVIFRRIVEMIPWLQEVVRKCVSVASFFSRGFAVRAVLKKRQRQEGKSFLVMPASACWGSHLRTLETVLENLDILKSMATEDSFVSSGRDRQERKLREDAAVVLSEASFADDLKVAIQLLCPIGDAIVTLEAESACLSDVYSVYSKLEQAVAMGTCYTADQLTMVKEICRQRWDELFVEVHGLAYVLDPRYEGAGMSRAQRRSAEMYLELLVPGSTAELAQYFAMVKELREDVRKSLVSGDLPVRTWARTMSAEQFPLLVPLVERIFGIAASSAACEKTFSSYNYIQNKFRNRLGDEMSTDAVYLQANIRQLRRLGIHHDFSLMANTAAGAAAAASASASSSSSSSSAAAVTALDMGMTVASASSSSSTATALRKRSYVDMADGPGAVQIASRSSMASARKAARDILERNPLEDDDDEEEDDDDSDSDVPV